MGQQWEFNNVSLNTKAWQVIEVSDLGIPKTRGSNIEIPYRHGKMNTRKAYDERSLMFNMMVKGVDFVCGEVPLGKSGDVQLHAPLVFLFLIFVKIYMRV